MSRAEPADLHIIDAGGTHERATVEFLEREGFLRQAGVTVRRTWVTNGAEAVELLLAGEGDVAMQVGFGPALVAIARGEPLRLIAGANLLSVHAIFSTDTDLRRLEDLPGHTVGVGRLGALTHQLAVAAMRKRNVDPTGVNFVSIGNSATIFRHLLAGKIDAGFGESEVFDRQSDYGVHALEGGVLWRDLPEFPNQASFATSRSLAEKREPIIRLLQAHASLYRALQDPRFEDSYVEAWRAALPEFDAEEGRRQWRFYRQYRPFAEDLSLPRAGIDYLQRLNVEMGLQQQILPLDGIAANDVAAEAVARIVPPIPARKHLSA